MTEEKKICEYLEVLSSKAPVPGGGGASALAGALGNALGQMVVNLTVGKKKYAEVEEETVMEEKLLDASMVPVEIMEKALELLEILDVLADKGSRMAVSDVGVAVQFTRTALLGAVMNVYINTKSMKNREKAEEINQGAKRMIKIGTSQADEIYEKVLAQLV